MKKALSYWIIFTLLFILLSPAISYAAKPGETDTVDMGNGYYIIYRPNGQKHISIEIKPNGEMTLYGEHHKSGSRISYWTMGYYLTLTPANGNLSSYKNKARLNMSGEQKDDPSDTDPSIIITTYHINADELIKKVLSLGVTADDLEKGQVVYMSNIFRTIGRKEGWPYNKFWYRSEDIYDLKKMQAAEWWSSTTKNDILPCYYDVKVTIKIKTNKYDVVYEDEDGNLLEEALKNQNILQTETINYTIPKTDYILKKDGKTYECAKKFYVTYEDGSKTAKKDSSYKIKYKYEKASDGVIHIIYKETSGGSITPTPPPIDPDVPAGGDITEPFTEVEATGVIQADIQDAERFDVTLGIPTTESLYAEVTTKDYLLGYQLIKRTGIKSYPVNVKKTYNLSWEETDYPLDPDEPPTTYTETDSVTVEKTVTIKRAYAYWEINNLDVYKLTSATLNNYALPAGSITLTPTGYMPPTVSYTHTSDIDSHLTKPSQVSSTITLPSQSIDGGDYRPSVPNEDFTSIVDGKVGQIKVKNDTLTFNGNTVLSGTPANKEGPAPNPSAIPQAEDAKKNTLFQSNQVIDSVKKNGTYVSNGTVTYSRIAAVNPNYSETLTYPVNDLNEVVIHTPVYCEAKVTNDNNRFVQLIDPTDYIPLVLDPGRVTCDFTVHISNFGTHNGYPGYGERDYSQSLRDPSVSYLATDRGTVRNEVKFPFDVYQDVGNDGNTSNDRLIRAGTWCILGRSTIRFYIPLWTPEGTYTAEFRTIAVNADDTSRSEPTYNADITNYVATDSIEFEVSGRLYGLTLYDVSDYPLWEDIFRVPNSLSLKKNASGYPDGTGAAKWNEAKSYTYTVGTQNQYGNSTGRNGKYTFPLVNGSHPAYSNLGVIKTGYMVRYSLETVGDYYSDASKILLQPTFYYVDAAGGSRQEVDLYYNETIDGTFRRLVKMGGTLDQINMKTAKVGDRYFAIPPEELKITAPLRNTTYARLLSLKAPMFTFTDIRLDSNFRTYCNTAYAASLPGGVPSWVDANALKTKVQRWYGQYYLPAEVHAVPKGYNVDDYAIRYGIDYSESFWLKNGYLIVNFDPVVTDENGRERLSYLNKDNYLNNNQCSMWVLEGPVISKTDHDGTTFSFKAGDFVMYYTDKSVQDDYISGGIY